MSSSNSQNVFILANGKQNAYSLRGFLDSARIMSYRQPNAFGQGGDVIRVASPIAQTVVRSTDGVGGTFLVDRATNDVIANVMGVPQNNIFLTGTFPII